MIGVENLDPDLEPREVVGHRGREVESPLLGEPQAGRGGEVLGDRPDLEQSPIRYRVAAIGIGDSVCPRRHESVARCESQRQAGAEPLAVALGQHPIDRSLQLQGMHLFVE